MSWLCSTFTCVEATSGETGTLGLQTSEDRDLPPAHLVLLQELELDRDVVSHPLVLLAVDLELLLGLLHLGCGGGVARPQAQLLQVGAVGVILNSG